jgi:hypothetical protein
MIIFQKSWYILILLASLKFEGSRTYNFKGIDWLRYKILGTKLDN